MYDEIDKNKLRVFQVILIFTSFAGILFAIINYFRGVHILAAIELIVALISAWLLLRVIKNQSAENFNKLTLIYVIMFYSLMIFAFSLADVSITIFTWALAIPLAAYYLLGVKKGFIVTAVYYTLTAWVFFSKNIMLPEKVAYANICIIALVFWCISHSYEYANFKAQEKLRKLAMHDPLTDLYNRSMMYQLFNRMQANAAKTNLKLAVVLFDLDRFKNINDSYGHPTGDLVLKKFANILTQYLNANDVAFRLGGEEFALFMQASTEKKIHEHVEFIRKATESIHIIDCFAAGTVTVSAGLAIRHHDPLELKELLKQADQLLYSAKSKGRNQIVKKTLRKTASVT